MKSEDEMKDPEHDTTDFLAIMAAREGSSEQAKISRRGIVGRILGVAQSPRKDPANLSTNANTVRSRQRMATFTEAEKLVENAKKADRAAEGRVRSLLKKDEAFARLSEKEKSRRFFKGSIG